MMKWTMICLVSVFINASGNICCVNYALRNVCVFLLHERWLVAVCILHVLISYAILSIEKDCWITI